MRQRQRFGIALLALVFVATGYWFAYAQDTADKDEHIIVTPQRIQWQAGPVSLPAGAEFAVLEGDPTKEGIFTMHLRLPDGYRIPPHIHSKNERVTVVSGTFRLGMGDTVEEGEMERLPAGSFFVMPPGMQHYAAVEGQTVIQITTNGPWTITYVNPADDPRKR